MKLLPPFNISSRLLPCIVIAGASIQLEIIGETHDHRTRYRWTIDLPDWCEEFSGDDLSSGCGGGSLQQGFSDLLCFLGAAAESWPDGENADLFPPAISEWAAQNSDEIGMAQCKVEETPDLITS